MKNILVFRSGIKAAMDTRKDFLNIQLIVYGTPAEEGGGGKILMLDSFKELDVCMMSHPAIVEIPDGKWLATTAFKFHFEGNHLFLQFPGYKSFLSTIYKIADGGITVKKKLRF